MKILCETSARHVHLSRTHLQVLFGIDELSPIKWLSQPGQFLSRKRVDLVTPKATIQSVAIIGPTRPQTQVELSATDCQTLGLRDVPVRQSGDLDQTPGLTLRAGEREVTLERGVIIAKRHVHLDPNTAREFGLTDGQVVSLRFDGERGGQLDNTIVRVSENSHPAAHIDTDEAHAMGTQVLDACAIVKLLPISSS